MRATRHFFWLALLLAFVASSSATPTLPQPNVHVVDGSIGSTLYSDRGSTSEFFTYNAVGHTVVLTDDSGAGTKSDLYEAFGNITSSSGTSANNRLANTKERDFSLGLDNHGMRYYDPTIGRYITRDPMGYGDGLNNYLYVHDNPINHIDPLGLALGDWYDPRSYCNSGFLEGVGAGAVNTGVGAVRAVGEMVKVGIDDINMVHEAATGEPFYKGYLSSSAKAFVNNKVSTQDYYRDTLANVATFGLAGQQQAIIDYSFGNISVDQFSQQVGGTAALQLGTTTLMKTSVKAPPPSSSALNAGSIEGANAVRNPNKVAYIGTMDDLKGIPRGQTILDELTPDLGSPKANYYRDMSVLRNKLWNGYEIRDASKALKNTDPYPTAMRPDRVVGQSFLGAERNMLNNRGLRLNPTTGVYE